MSADPSSWSDEKLEAHARQWMGLPTLQCRQVMNDQDVAEWSDVLHIRALVEELAQEKIRLENEIREGKSRGEIPGEALTWLWFLTHSAEAWTPRRLEFLEPWPTDEAAVMLAAWRTEEKAA